MVRMMMRVKQQFHLTAHILMEHPYQSSAGSRKPPRIERQSGAISDADTDIACFRFPDYIKSIMQLFDLKIAVIFSHLAYKISYRVGFF